MDTKTKKHEENVIGKFKVLPFSECTFSHGPVPHCLDDISQWGLSSETSNGDSAISVTYPITFSVFNVAIPVLYSTSGHKQHEGGGGDGITESNLKGFSFYHGSDIRNCKLYWFVIGK